jgi:hypothetical protein
VSEFRTPAYGQRSLSDVLPAALAALGVDLLPRPTNLSFTPADHYVVMLVDGLGHHQIAAHPRQAPFLHSLLETQPPGTCGVPSTTATSLTSLGTGVPTGQHGMVGFTQRIPETGHLLNSLFWDQPVDPLEWQPLPTVFEQAAANGVQTTVVSKREFVDSGLTRSALRGGNYVGTGNVDERIEAAVAASGQAPSLTFVYDGDLDAAGHKSGVDSDLWRAQLEIVDEDVQDLRAALPSNVGLVVTADHGMVDATAESRIDIDQIPGIREDVQLLGGEARFRHLYCANGRAERVRDRWQEELGDRVTALTRQEAITAGWFGEVRPEVSARLGDVVVAAHGQVALFSSEDFAYEMGLVGLHGSLTPAEMEIPILQVG